MQTGFREIRTRPIQRLERDGRPVSRSQSDSCDR